MSAQLTLSGIVFDQGTEKRLSGTTIRLQTPTKVLLAETNENGVYTFPPIDEPDLKEGQETYEISIHAYNKEGRQQEPAPLRITIEKGTESHTEVLKMINRGPVSNGAGMGFLAFLILVLVGLAYFYYLQHKPGANSDREKATPDIVNSLTKSLVDRITADSISVSAFQLEDDLIDSADLAIITAELQQTKEAVDELFIASQVDSAYQALIRRNLEDVNQGIDRKNKEKIQAALVSSKKYIAEIPNLKPSWFWQTVPNIYYEIIFWALFATLLRLIGNTSYYVSRNNFFRDSVWHKLPLLFTIPLIALLISIVISFFKIVISIGGAEFELDFSNPYISIILASLIGLAPWRAWEFMYGLADKLFNGLKKWLGLGKPGDVKSEGAETSNQQNNAEPVDPKEPEDPIDPNEPTEPEDPTDPNQPIQPRGPSDPSLTDNPTTPTKPETVADPKVSNESNPPTNPISTDD